MSAIGVSMIFIRNLFDDSMPSVETLCNNTLHVQLVVVETHLFLEYPLPQVTGSLTWPTRR